MRLSPIVLVRARHLAPSADALNFLVEYRVFLDEHIRQVLLGRHVIGRVRQVAGPRLTMADRSLRDGAVARANGRFLAATLRTNPRRTYESDERHQDDRLSHVTPPISKSLAALNLIGQLLLNP